MSKNVNDCDVVLELLPYYLDQKTGEESNRFVQEHLTGCAECREVYQLMSADFLESEVAVSRQEQARAKRKRRRLSRSFKRTLLVVAGLLAYFCLVIGVVAYTVWLLVRV